MSIFKQKTNYFFEQFVIVGDYSLKAVEILKEGLTNFKPENSLKLKNDVHLVEHQADLVKHEVEERLAKEFITPIDREDIFLLLNNIDDLTDSIDEISYKLYMRNYEKLPEHTDLFLQKSFDGIVAVNNVLKQLTTSYNDKAKLDPLIEKVKEIEEEADHLYEENVHALYASDKDISYREIVQIEKMYSMFEYVTDKCRDITRTVSIIMYKNM